MINLAAACAQLSGSLQEVRRRMYALAPELADDRVQRDVALMVRMYGDDIMDPERAPDAARRVLYSIWGNALGGMVGAPTIEWWRSPLGQSVAHWVGFYLPEVPYVAAAKILDVSRQRIYQLVKDEGKLIQVPGRHAVTADSLAAHIRSMG